jgi:hypothetical protein
MGIAAARAKRIERSRILVMAENLFVRKQQANCQAVSRRWLKVSA